MENITVACAQQRLSITDTREGYEASVRRFLRQAQAKAADIVVFPELSGIMLAPPLISGFKLGFIKRADQGSQPTAGFVSRRLGRVSGAAAGALGGGFRGSLVRLLSKNSDALRDAYFETFGAFAREYGMVVVGGSLYLFDEEAGAVRNRAYLFDVDGEVLGYQDKLNLAPDEEGVASPGTDVKALETRFGRLGILIGRDSLYPELARLLAIQGAELIAGIVASPGQAQGSMIRSALALRVEENQVFAAASFLLGVNYLGKANREDLFGKSALLAPISLTEKGDGVLVQAGTNRTEGLIAAALDAQALQDLWETSGFRPRAQMNVGDLAPALADFYREGLSIEQAIEQGLAGPVEAEPAFLFEPVPMPDDAEAVDLPPESLEPTEPEAEDELALTGEADETQALPEGTEELPASVPEALSLTAGKETEEEQAVDSA